MTHTYDPTELDVTALDDSEPQSRIVCRECGLPETAHKPLADHPDEERLRLSEVQGATTLASLARKASRALREHRRVDALVLLTQLTVTADRQRLGMKRAISDQMKATSERPDES